MPAPMKVQRGGKSSMPPPMSQAPQETGIFIEQGKKLKVDPKLLIDHLNELGYAIKRRGAGPELLHLREDGVVFTIADPAMLGPAIEQSLSSTAEKRAWADFASKDPFSKGFLNMLQELEGEFLKDTKDTMYFPFANGYVEVTAKGIKLLPYDGKRLVWDSQRRKHEINLKGGNKKCMFDAFMRNLAGKDNLKFIQWSMGYLMHDYFLPGRSRIVILYDKAATKGNHGRTGKDLLLASVANVRRTTRIDARAMNKDDNRYMFGSVDEETQFLQISDPRYYSVLSDLFNRVESQFLIEQKYKVSRYLPNPPKIGMTSNIMFPAENSSEKERQIPIILNPYYRDLGVDEPIVKTHGKRFFTEWNVEDWNKFYYTMFMCGQVYMQSKGIPKIDFESVYVQSLKQQQGPFIKLVEERLAKGKKSTFFLIDLAEQYIEENDMPNDADTRRETCKEIAKALQNYTKVMGFKVTTARLRRPGGGDLKVKQYSIQAR
jgi:hypothetical protein